MRNTSSSTLPNLQRGFTLVEMLVVAPLIILLIGTLIAYITTLTGDSLQLRERGDMAYGVQSALDSIENDSIKATRFLATSGTLPSPQGKDSSFNGTAAFTSSDSLVIGVIATSKDPLNPDRIPINYENQPHPCGSNQSSNTFLITKAIYFVKDGSLWRRTIVPSYNMDSPPNDYTVCNTPWQRNSCSIGQTASICRSEDSELVKNVSDFTVKYYTSPSSTTPLAAADAKKAKTIEVSITTQKTVAGDSITQDGSIKVTRLNDIDADLVAPSQAPVISDININDTLSATFSWDKVPNASSYKISYSINGGAFVDGGTITGTSYTINTTRKDNITFRVAGRNSYGVTPTTQATASVPSTVPCDLNNNWQNYPAPYGEASFTKTSAGVVALGGLIRLGNGVQYETICTLPEGYRPSSRLIFAPSTNGTTQARIDIETNGDVVYIFGSTGWISLNGINFLAKDTATWTNLTGVNGWTAYGGGLTAYAPPQIATDATGRIHLQGLASSGTATSGTTMFNLPASVGTIPYRNIYAARSSTVGNMDITNTNTIAIRAGANGYFSLQAMFYPSTAGTWSNMTLASGWSAYPSPYGPGQYIKNADGIVSLRGLIRNTNQTASTGVPAATVLATLPVGYRPATDVICSQTTYPNVYGRIDVRSNGQIITREGVTYGWVSLAGCDYVAEQ